MAQTTNGETKPIQLKKEKTSVPITKSSTEILSELFGVFNAEPPTISECLPNVDLVKKNKKAKKKSKHKDKKKKSEKRGRSSSDRSIDEISESEPIKKKSKKSKHRKHKKRSSSRELSFTPKRAVYSPEPYISMPPENSENSTNDRKVTLDMGQFCIQVKNSNIKDNKKVVGDEFDIKPHYVKNQMDSIPIPKMPDISQIKLPEEATSNKNSNNHVPENSDKNKSGTSKIQIKSLKFSSVFVANVKQAEEEARKKAEKYEDGELTDSSHTNTPKGVSDPEEENEPAPTIDLRSKLLEKSLSSKTEEEKFKSEKRHTEKSKTSSRKSRKSRSRSKKRSRSKSKRRSRSRSRKRSRSRSKKRSRSRNRRSSSRTRKRSRSRSRHRSRSKRSHSHTRNSRSTRHHDKSDDYRSRKHERRRSKDMTRLDIDKKRLLEIARKNAINMLQTGALPAAGTLGPQAQQKVISAIKSGGKSVDELTDFCKNLSRQEAMGELSSVSSDSELDNELHDTETRAFHHPFQVKDKAPIVLNIKGGTPLPTQSFQEKTIEQSKVLRLQFPVSSGTQHRGAESEWRPVSPTPTKAAPVPAVPSLPKHVPNPPLISSSKASSMNSRSHTPPLTPMHHAMSDSYMATQNTSTSAAPLAIEYNHGNLTSTVPGVIQPPIVSLVPPGPQVFPTEVNANIDIGSIVSQRLTAIRKLQQNPNDVSAISQMYQVNQEMSKWAQSKQEPGQFTGSTGVQILTPRELASGYQAWAKRDQLQTAAPVSGGMGMHLLQKMGWRPGEGLGKEKNGSLTPLLLEVKLDTRGLVAKEEVKQRNNTRRPGAATVKTLAGKHPVSLLGEFCSKRKLGVPSYTLCFECGPDHKKNFLFKVTVNGTEYQPSVASANKKQAKADAAQLCLQKLGLLT